ncbi:insulinase family protein [Pseudaminobacter arsenicus]|uniref:Insulinase family protein n=1 Tax=Borborobacter arsenicus TaxID=1851146 RepID=A0A432V214_9HYPH|nr:pitrilysin family protein [Pseudaminobacter arsenicus]RUM96165.1 insulinase family protein [Pseudaminobacter arsenicus]
MNPTLDFRGRIITSATVFALAVVFLVLPCIAPARAEMKIQEVTSSQGITAWLVEDYSVPLIAIRFAFDGGSSQDPKGKEGLANLMTGLFDEGAGELDSEAFQSQLDDAGAEMRFSAGRDTIYGSMRLLAEQKDDAFNLLRLAITEPRFDQAPIDRIRAQIVSGIISGSRDPEVEAQFKWATALYGDHPYARRSEGTEQSLATITADDLHAFHKAMFARGKLKVAVVGAIDAETLKGELDKLFGALPGKPELTPIADVRPKLAQTVSVEYELPQTSLQLAYPGVRRDSPEFFGAVVMNHILGGGTFTSRLFEEVREKRGLAYGVSSSLVNYDHANALVVSTSTRSDKAAETLDLVREVVRKMADEGPTEAELAAAKKYLTGAYAINNLNSSGAIASTLAELQLQHLGIDYMERRGALIDAVTLEDTKEAARKLLAAEPAVLVVGPAMAGTDKE